MYNTYFDQISYIKPTFVTINSDVNFSADVTCHKEIMSDNILSYLTNYWPSDALTGTNRFLETSEIRLS